MGGFFFFFFFHSSLLIYPYPLSLFLISFFIVTITCNDALPYSTTTFSLLPNANSLFPHQHNHIPQHKTKIITKNHKFESGHKNKKHLEIHTSKSYLSSMDIAVTVLRFDSIFETYFSSLYMKLLVLKY